MFSQFRLQVAREFDPIRENHFACRFEQADVSFGGDGVLAPIVCYYIGQQSTFTCETSTLPVATMMPSFCSLRSWSP